MIEFESLKNVLDIEDVAVNYLNLPHKKIGGRMSILCPFHGDRHFGSCYLYKNNNRIRCYVCNKSYDSIDLTMRVKNCTLPEAVKSLADYYGIEVDNRPAKDIRYLTLSADMLIHIGITDTAALKQLFAEDAEVFWEFLNKSAIRCECRYMSVTRQPYPVEVKTIAGQRLVEIKKFKEMIASNKNKKYDAIRIKQS